jgi:hypothetical protein
MAVTYNPKSYFVDVPHGTDFNAVGNSIDFDPYIATFMQIENRSAISINVRLNDDEDSDFILRANTVQVFNKDDIHATKIAFSNTVSGSTAGDIEIIAGLRRSSYRRTAE